jgi:cysteinyl-tRNA synthetase
MTTPSDELDPLDLLEIEPDEAELSEEGLKRRGFHTADPKTADEDEEEDIPKAIELEEILVKADDDAGEDKMEKGAKKYGKTVWEIASEFEAFFWKTIDLMGIAHPTVSCRATDHIPEQIELIKRLEKNGFTYTIADGVYFDTSKFPSYGELAHIDAEKLKAGARVEMVEGKKHVTDFALWKFSPTNEKRAMEWESPWGVGFPGWHIECSAMSMKYLGEQFDIHTGGIDHIQIHHSNEIALFTNGFLPVAASACAISLV